MSTINPRLLRALRETAPEIREEDVIAVQSTDLDLLIPQKKAKTLSVLTREELLVYTGKECTLREKTADISSFEVIPGVGCSFSGYTRATDGERVLFARADGRFHPMMAQAAKRMNHYLRFGNTDFSRFSEEGGRVCPKCGRPYPRNSQTCPRCSSKRKALRRLLSLSKPEWGYLAVASVMFFLSTGIGLIIPMINRTMVDDYINKGDANVFLAGFLGVVAALLAANVARRAVGVIRGYLLTIGGTRLSLRLRDHVFRKIQELSIAKISKRTTGELMKRVSGDTNRIRVFLTRWLPNVLEQSLLLVVISVFLITYDWKLALLILLPAPFVAFAFRTFFGKVRSLSDRAWELNSRADATLHDIFSGIRVVKAYGMEKREEERFVEMAASERDATIRLDTFWMILRPILDFLMGIGEYILLYYVGSKMLAGSMTAGEMAQFSAYASMLFGPLGTLMGFPRQFIQMMTSLNRIYEVMDEPVDVRNPDAEALPPFKGFIDVDHVSFGYEDSKEVLRDINLHIEPGEFIGLVGKSGVGKSTLINLIMRMYDVDEGSIRIDGTDIRKIPQEELRSQMGVVLQENFLFTGTVWQNLTYAKPDATPEEVIRAAKMAGAHDFIIRLPDGYNTYVGEKGHTLSGGERQRVSIARALLHDPKILILDEATASLDTETEKLIQDALQVLSAGRTTIAIAHRLSTLRNATRLVVLDQGGIAEVGTHEELMAKEGIYYGLVMAQREMTKMPGTDKTDDDEAADDAKV